MKTVVARTPADWRNWLAENCQTEKEVWLIIHHEDSPIPSIRYPEAVEHALCYGWIDGLHRKHDTHNSQLRFTPRTPRSTWSRVNRQRAEMMIERGPDDRARPGSDRPGQGDRDLASGLGRRHLDHSGGSAGAASTARCLTPTAAPAARCR